MGNIVQVDIKTRFIPDHRKVFIIFPGRNYRYYTTMAESSAVFLDLPGFPIRSDHAVASLIDIEERIAISDAIVSWHRKGKPADDLPPRRVSELESFRSTKRRRFLTGVTRSFFSSMAAGDVVIVPPQNFDDDVLLGEMVDDGSDITLIDAPFHFGEKIPARRVKWLAREKRFNVPPWLERKIPSPNPVRQLERKFHKYAYDILYERYVFDGQFVCRFDIDSKDFSTLDNFLVQKLFLYATALYDNNQKTRHSDLSKTSLLDVVSHIEFSEEIPDQRIIIRSPGSIVLYSRNIVPLVAGVLIALSAVTAGEMPSTITIINSQDKSDASLQCQLGVQQEVISDLQMMGYARWVEWCKAEIEARKRTAIQPGMPTAIVEDATDGTKQK
jgi:hypothetical protein